MWEGEPQGDLHAEQGLLLLNLSVKQNKESSSGLLCFRSFSRVRMIKMKTSASFRPCRSQAPSRRLRLLSPSMGTLRPGPFLLPTPPPHPIIQKQGPDARRS